MTPIEEIDLPKLVDELLASDSWWNPEIIYVLLIVALVEK